MAGQNAARLAVQLALESGTFSGDVQAAIDKFVKLPNAIKRESKNAAKDIELMRYAIADYGKEVSHVTKMQRELYGDFGKYKSAAAEQHGLAMSMLQVAHAMDKQVEAQKKLNETKPGGMNAQQKAALGYQTTDIITSLAGGQNPMLVLLQQGGQLRDQFGGFGALFKGIAEAVTLSRVAMVSLAGGIGAVAYATYQGNEELRTFNNQLILSGNLANQTYDKYIDASRALAKSQSVSIATAKEAYGAVAASGQFTEKSIVSVSNAVAAFARTAGVSGTEAAQKLIPALNGDADAALNLNKQLNFLNQKQIDFINSTKLSADKIGVMRVASEALTEHLEKSKANIGYFERMGKAASDLFTIFKEWGANNDAKKLRNLNEEILALEDTIYKKTRPLGRTGKPALDADSPALITMREQLSLKKKQKDDLDNAIKSEAEESARLAKQNEDARKKAEALGKAGGPEAGQKLDYEAEKLRITAKYEAELVGVSELTKIRIEAERDIALKQAEIRQKNFVEQNYWVKKNQAIETLAIEEIRATAAKKKDEYLKKDADKDFQIESMKAEHEFQIAVEGLDKFKRIELEAKRDIAKETARLNKLDIEEKHAFADKNEKELIEYSRGRLQKAKSDAEELSRASFEEVRKNLQTQQNSVDLEKEKLSIYEKNFLISDADYKIELLKLETKQKIKEIDENKNLGEAKKEEARSMVLELQRSKIAVDQLDTRLKMLKDSGAFVFKSMEDAIIQFTRTGKLSFKDLVGTIIRGLLEIQMRAQSTKLFAMLGSMLFATPRADLIGANAVLGTNQSLDSFDLPQRAMGGSVAANDSYIVGENGPEMFVPRQSGTIVPNGQLSSMGNQPQVIYNGPYIASMSAIDTQSATQFLARNKNAVWSANQSASRGLPTNR